MANPTPETRMSHRANNLQTCSRTNISTVQFARGLMKTSYELGLSLLHTIARSHTLWGGLETKKNYNTILLSIDCLLALLTLKYWIGANLCSLIGAL